MYVCRSYQIAPYHISILVHTSLLLVTSSHLSHLYQGKWHMGFHDQCEDHHVPLVQVHTLMVRRAHLDGPPRPRKAHAPRKWYLPWRRYLPGLSFWWGNPLEMWVSIVKSHQFLCFLFQQAMFDDTGGYANNYSHRFELLILRFGRFCSEWSFLVPPWYRSWSRTDEWLVINYCHEYPWHKLCQFLSGKLTYLLKTTMFNRRTHYFYGHFH